MFVRHRVGARACSGAGGPSGYRTERDHCTSTAWLARAEFGLGACRICMACVGRTSLCGVWDVCAGGRDAADRACTGVASTSQGVDVSPAALTRLRTTLRPVAGGGGGGCGAQRDPGPSPQPDLLRAVPRRPVCCDPRTCGVCDLPPVLRSCPLATRAL
eukprot:2922308-Prymnesium_polylepis.1